MPSNEFETAYGPFLTCMHIHLHLSHFSSQLSKVQHINSFRPTDYFLPMGPSLISTHPLRLPGSYTASKSTSHYLLAKRQFSLP